MGKTEKEPKDHFFLVRTTCFLLGFMNLAPLLFASTAAGYWLYKFRDPSIGSGTTLGMDRTTLQAYYQPVSMVAQQVPSVTMSCLMTVYGHKVPHMRRTLVSLLLFIGLYLLFTLFTQINTDSWQTPFFVVAIFLSMMNSSLAATMQMSTAVLISKLPHEYLMYFLIGQNGAFISTFLQIISLALTDDQPTSGLLYFSSGAILILITLVLTMLSRKTKVFEYYEIEAAKEQHSEMINWAEAKEVIKKMWPCQAVLGLMIMTISTIHPSITTLVVSQNEANHTAWTEKFFTPVCAFLVIEVSAIIGRIMSRKFFITESNKYWYVGLTVLRLFISIPICMLFDAEPRNFPVVFDKDWEFIVFMFIFGFTNGWIWNVSAMSLKTLVPKKQEVAFKLLALTISVFSAITVANGLLAVKVLLI